MASARSQARAAQLRQGRAPGPRLSTRSGLGLRQGAPEAITRSTDRLHQGIMFGGFECLAQPAYVHVDRPFLDKDVVAPDLVEQLGAAVDALRMGHEKVQHPELGRTQVDVAAGGADSMRDRVELEILDLDDVVGELGGAAPHHRLDARQELPGRERLGDVVVRTALEAPDRVLLLRPPGDPDDRDVLGALIGAQLAREIHSWRARQHPVEEHQVRQNLADQRLGLRNVRSAQYLMTGMLEIDGDQLLDRRFVFDYEYRAAHDRPAPALVPRRAHQLSASRSTTSTAV